MDSDSPETIEHQMHGTRESLADKIGALEHAVADALHGAKQQVSDTVKSLTGAVHDTVEDVTGGVHSLMSSTTGGVQALTSGVGDNIKEAFSVSPMVEKNPLQAVGVATLAGFITGMLFLPGKASHHAYAAPAVGYHPAAGMPAKGAGLFDELIQMLGTEVRKIGENAIQSLSKSVNHNVTTGLPKLLDNAVSHLADAVPTVGGGSAPAAPATGYAPTGPGAKQRS